MLLLRHLAEAWARGGSGNLSAQQLPEPAAAQLAGRLQAMSLRSLLVVLQYTALKQNPEGGEAASDLLQHLIVSVSVGASRMHAAFSG